MVKAILCCLSGWGYWGEELVGPYDVLTAQVLEKGVRRYGW